MARPREFDEAAALDAAIDCFWQQGYGATSVRDLAERMGITGASLYNAFGDKRSLFRRALGHYLDHGFNDRVRRLEPLPPRQAITTFFAELIERSLTDPQHKGCLLVNSALEIAPHDPEFRQIIADWQAQVEAFFQRCLRAGQADGTIATTLPADDLARHLLGVMLGLRVLARCRPERPLLEGLVRPALALLDPGGPAAGADRAIAPVDLAQI